MKNLQQVLRGVMIALASIGLILGGFSLSLTEGNVTSALAPTQTLMPTHSVTLQPSTPLANSPTFSPSSTRLPSHTLTSTQTSTWTPTLPPSPTNCPPPVGWLPYPVQSGDTLEKIATLHQISVSELQQANCLLMTTGLLPVAILYVPPAPTQTQLLAPTQTRLPAPTQIQVPCGHPSSWIVYIIQQGDTLYRLSQAYGISVGELQRANCMGNSTILYIGQKLYVPPWAVVHTPLPTIPAAFTPTPILTDTPNTGLPSDTPVPTNSPVPTDTPIPTDIPIPTTETPITP